MNRKEIMTRAWEMRKDLNLTMSEALRRSWMINNNPTGIFVYVTRPNGKKEVVNLKGRISRVDESIAKKIKDDTKTDSGSIVTSIVWTRIICKSNLKELVRSYNNVVNEGGSGYIPETSFFSKNPRFWSTMEVVKRVF